MASEDRFGYEWDKYSDIYPDYEQQFLNWISPLDSEDFIGKDILDAGCGMGRNSYYALQYGDTTACWISVAIWAQAIWAQGISGACDSG